VVGGLLLGRFGWPAIFWVNVPVTLLAAAVVHRAPAATARATLERPRLDVAGTVLATATITVVVALGIESGHLAPAQLVAGVIVALVLITVTVAMERRRARTGRPTMVPASAWRSRSFNAPTPSPC
jgi:DHA2 family methylenomycin A resistance protein-like MFS transporter